MPTLSRPLLTRKEFNEIKATGDVDTIIKALSRFVKKKPGAKRIYVDNKRKQVAYRRRVKKERAAIVKTLNSIGKQLQIVTEKVISEAKQS